MHPQAGRQQGLDDLHMDQSGAARGQACRGKALVGRADHHAHQHCRHQPQLGKRHITWHCSRRHCNISSPPTRLGIARHKLVVGSVRDADPGVGAQRVGQANHDLQRHAPVAQCSAHEKRFKRIQRAACAAMWQPATKGAPAQRPPARLGRHCLIRVSRGLPCNLRTLSPTHRWVLQNVCCWSARWLMLCIVASLVRCQSMNRVSLRPAGQRRQRHMQQQTWIQHRQHRAAYLVPVVQACCTAPPACPPVRSQPSKELRHEQDLGMGREVWPVLRGWAAAGCAGNLRGTGRRKQSGLGARL